MNNKAAQAYFQTKVSTTDQGQLLLLLYDGALKFLQQAREKMLEKDYAAKGILISKVLDIISELSNTLNLEKGGTLAENLNNLYFLCTTRLLQANLKMNVEQLDSVSTILSGLRSAYAQIINTPEAQKAAAQIAAKINAEGSMMQRAAHISAPVHASPAFIGQAQARNAYGQQAAQPTAAAPVTAPVAPAAPVVAAPMTPAPMVATPVAASGTALAAAASVPQSVVAPAPVSVAAPAAAPTAQAAPVVSPRQGFAAPQLSKKLASYAKMG